MFGDCMKKIYVLILIIVFSFLLTTGCIIKDEEITYSAKKPVEAPTATPKPTPNEKYPETIIQWMIPFSQATDIDAWSRALGEAFDNSEQWRIMYTNISGGLSGSTGLYKVLNSKHDGYMFSGFGERNLSVPVYVEGEMTSADWEYYIAGGCPSVLCVSPDLGPNTIEEFITAAKNIEEDNLMTLATSGGGLQAALPFYFATQSEIEFEIKDYKTDDYAKNACMNLEVDAIIAPANMVAEAIDDHDLIPIAVMEDKAYTNHSFYDETLPSIRDMVPSLKQEALVALKQMRGFAIPKETDTSILLAVEESFKSLANITSFNEFAKDNYANIYIYSGDEARQQVELTERYLCWILSDMRKSGFTPEYVGIERPY
jgi:tripartite-type tricarboxylate transporter receptor subunit TctC